jgi:hypothetical protein
MAPTTAREMAIFRCFTGDTEKQGNALTANYFTNVPCVPFLRSNTAQTSNLLV